MCFFEIVRGVAAGEVIASFPNTETGVFLRIKLDGEYVVSAEPPPPLAEAEWIEVAESTFVRVSRGTRGCSRSSAGRHVSLSERGFQAAIRVVRANGLGGGPSSVARAVTRPWTPSPRLVSCPSGMEFVGMVFSGLPDGNREHRIAYPMPCS